MFTDWEGYQSPIAAVYHSVVTVRNTVFRNMRLPVEIADVSFDGTVRFDNVSLANVALQHGAVVSTSLNDYRAVGGGLDGGNCPDAGAGMHTVRYYADDDDGPAYDVALTAVAPGEGGAFGAESVIVHAAMSDCIGFLHEEGLQRPGCPEPPAAARRRVLARVCRDLAQGMRAGTRARPAACSFVTVRV